MSLTSLAFGSCLVNVGYELSLGGSAGRGHILRFDFDSRAGSDNILIDGFGPLMSP